MKDAIIICSHINSARLKKKPFIKVGGRTILECLIDRCLLSELPVIVAVPSEQMGYYTNLVANYPDRVHLFSGPTNDPLKRMAYACKHYKLRTCVRVCHDKIFVDPINIKTYVKFFNKSHFDYLRDTNFIAGTGFEVISAEAICNASELYNDVEHITYAMLSSSDRTMDLGDRLRPNDIRLLIDYSEDLDVIEHLVTKLGHMAPLYNIVSYLRDNPNIAKRNLLPEVTIYTCAYNAEKYISETIESVIELHGKVNFEYIIIDDCSTDRTLDIVKSFESIYPEIKVIKNEKNIGLSSSSNIALSEGRGEFIMRIDADDKLYKSEALRGIIQKAKTHEYDVVYPNYFDDKTKKVKTGETSHHVGGALFNRVKLKELKFRDGLRHHDSLDIFLRARETFNIGYYKAPLFFYRNTPNSMSKTDLEERDRIECSLKQL